MAESFINSKSGRFVLRRNVGNARGNVSNQLSDDEDDKPEEDEYDALNDETFGIDLSSGGLDDWEQSHEQFAKIGDSFGNGKHDESVKNIEIHNEGYYGSVDEDEATNIENSLNQLVLDDDVDDPAILEKHVSKPAYRLNDSHSYNVSPPPPAIVESNHVGSPSTSSIWSTCTPKGDMNKGFGNTLFNHFRMSSPMLDLQLRDPCIITASNDERKQEKQFTSASKMFPNAKTLEEIENDLLHSQSVQRNNNREIPLKARVLTVGDLENNLNMATTDLKSKPKKPIGPPPGFSNRATIPRNNEMSSPFSPMPMHLTSTPHGLSHVPARLPQSMSPTSLINCNTKPSPLAPVHLIRPTGNIIIPPQLTHPTAFRPTYIGQYPAGHPLLVGQVPYRPPYNHQIPQFLGFQDKREALSNYLQHSGLHKNLQNNGCGLRGFDNYTNGWKSHSYMNQSNSNVEIDEYANLMSKREKEWLIQIQMIQLQSDNPYIDDFYYTNFMLKKRVKETKQKEPTLVIPERSKVVETRTYKPVQYEGSLGKLQAGSVTCPRKMIEVRSAHNDDSEAEAPKLANRETKRLRQLLLDIEKLYCLVLQADDIDKRVVVLPEEARLPLYDLKKEEINKLYLAFIQNGGQFLLQMISIRKGRNLLNRSIILFSKEQLTDLMTIILSNLSTVLKRDISDQIGPIIYAHFVHLISSSGLDILYNFGEKFCEEKEDLSNKSQCQLALEHKFGIAFVCDMICRAEEIYREDANQDSKIRSQWEKVVTSIFNYLKNASLPTLTNYIPQLTFVEHLQRFFPEETAITSVKKWMSRPNAKSRNSTT